MNHPISRLPQSSSIVSRLVLVLASAAVTGACSGSYPLGETSGSEQLLTDGTATGTSGPADSHVSAVLAPPDRTFSDPHTIGVAPVGDLDGDGRDELATSVYDFVNDVAVVHLRYGRPRPTDSLEALAFEQEGAYLAIGNGFHNMLGVAGAGDIDHDGYDDLLITAGGCTNPQPGNGVYLVYGGPERLDGLLPLDGAAAHFVPPQHEAPSEGYSCASNFSVRGVSDIDGDGIDDFVAVHSPIVDTTNGDPLLGRGEGLYVFYGRAERFRGEIPYADADAWLHIDPNVELFAAGDLNADGLADLLLGVIGWAGPGAPRSYFVPGRAERWSGMLELESNATPLGDAQIRSMAGWAPPTGDFDGDGASDVLLADADENLSLFYGAPGLFADGVDFSRADAIMEASHNLWLVHAVGDRDADGDDELLDLFYVEGRPSTSATDVALASGTRERLSGAFSFPESEVVAAAPDGRFPGEAQRSIETVFPAGDLDGDGAADLIVESAVFVDHDSGTSVRAPRLHVHYGTPAVPAAVVLR